MENIISVTAVVVSVLILAWQTTFLRKQTVVQTESAVASAGNDGMALLHTSLHVLVERPELRPYFYGGAIATPGTDGDRIAVLAEMIADSVEVGCDTAETQSSAGDSLAGWSSYGRFLLANSPTTCDLVTAHPDWYPRLASIMTM